MGLARTRLIVLLTACALLACTAVYSSHGLADRDHGHSHCDLCVHFSGTAGAPAAAAAIAKAVLVVRAQPAPAVLLLIARPPLGAHFARGPPR